MEIIKSTQNKQVKYISSLVKKSKARKEENLFVAEGIKMFLEAPPEYIKKVYVSETFIKREDNKKLLTNTKYEILSDTVFEMVSDTKTPQGILCLINQLHYSEEHIYMDKAPLILVLEDLQDPGNLGTIVRTSEGAGVTGIILSKGCVDIYNPKTIRSTMGSIYRVPFIYEQDILKAVGKLKRNKINVYAAHLDESVNYDRLNFKNPTAFLIGNEGSGLSEELSGLADSYLKIPMSGSVESLNAGIAAAVLTYEAARQRRY